MAIDSTPDEKVKRADLNDVNGQGKGWNSCRIWSSNAERCSKDIRGLKEMA